SPDLNPIELAFSKFKKLLRDAAARTTETLWELCGRVLDLFPEHDDAHEPSFDFGLMDATKEFQREFITRAVKRVKGNMSDAAKLLGLHRSNLYRKMRQLDMEVVED
ncbi:MAG: hypothetical protein H0T47_11780, partial [Planctomycetaceae bacterium]|nr:hypothetical protein [Planctomycetaceae bacterium]